MFDVLRKINILPLVKEPSPEVYQQVLEKYPKYREEEKDQGLEYRDEANRSRWSFFDEYEYRLPRLTSSNHSRDLVGLIQTTHRLKNDS